MEKRLLLFEKRRFDPSVTMDRTQLKIGMKVTLNAAFLNMPKGTKGVLVTSASTWPRMDTVSIKWKRFEGDSLIYYFSYEQLQYLDVL